MTRLGASLVLLAAAVAAWPMPSAGELRLRWLARHRLGSVVDAVESQPPAVGRQTPTRRTNGVIATLAAGCLLCAALTQGLLPGLMAACVVSVCWRVLVVTRADRGKRRDRAHLAAAVAAVLDECAAGASLGVALMNSAPVAGARGPAFTAAAAALVNGREVASVWRDQPGLAGLSLACSLTAETGATPGPALAAVLDELDADTALGAAVAEILAGPMSSAALLATLPVLGIGLGAMMGANPVRVLLHTTWGQLVFAGGVALDLSGVLWTLRLARRARP